MKNLILLAQYIAVGLIALVLAFLPIDLGLTVKRVSVEGLSPLVNKVAVEKLLNNYVGVNKYRLNFESLREELISFSWVESASVLWVYPGELKVVLTTPQLKGVVAYQGSLFWVDSKGELYDFDSTESSKVTYQLFQVVEWPSLEVWQSIFKLQEELSFMNQYLDSWIYMGNNRWKMRLLSGAQIYLPVMHNSPHIKHYLAWLVSELGADFVANSYDFRLPLQLIIRPLNSVSTKSLNTSRKVNEAQAQPKLKPPASKQPPKPKSNPQVSDPLSRIITKR